MPRKQHSYHFLYKTTCIITGRYYYGMHSTSDLNDGYLGSGKMLWYSIEKHGKDNHRLEILRFFDSRESLKIGEAELITEEVLKEPMCMNLKLGGEGFWPSQKGELNSCYGRKRSEEHKLAMVTALKERFKDPSFKSKMYSHLTRCDWTGREHKDETKKKIGNANSISQSGNRNSQYGTKWINNSIVNLKIKTEDLETYLANGWNLGRKMKLGR
jgi:hypothetical protein